MRNCPLYSTDSKGGQVSLFYTTLEHRTSCIGDWTCDSLAGNSKLRTLWYRCCAGDSPPPWSCGSGGPVHVVLVVC